MFSPNGRRVLTASEDKTARVWDLESGKPVTGPLLHRAEVFCAQFSPDGGRVATACYDGTVRIWDANTGFPLSEPLRHGGRVCSVQFSPDGRRVLSASDEGTARSWMIEPLTAPVPVWLPQLAEAIAQERLNEAGDTERVPAAELFKLQEQLGAVTDDTSWSRWGRWFFADRGARTISAFAPVLVSDYAAALTQWTNDLSAMREAVKLAPSNGVAIARLARTFLPTPPLTTGNWPEVEYLCRRAEMLTPDDPDVLQLRRTLRQRYSTLPHL